MLNVVDLIDRAATDPGFLMDLQRDPLGATRAAGFAVSHAELRDMLAMPGAPDGQIAEVLQARLSYSSKSDTKPVNYNCNCSACAGCGGGT